VVLCREKDQPELDLDCPLPSEAPERALLVWKGYGIFTQLTYLSLSIYQFITVPQPLRDEMLDDCTSTEGGMISTQRYQSFDV
jgi:hypothetical protein